MAPIRAISKKGSSKSTPSRNATPNPIKARKVSPKSSRPSKQLFKGKIMSVAGNFLDINQEALSHEKIAKWITEHGGTFEREVSKETTHLICTIEEYKKKSAQVQKAWENGKGHCHIVVLDWLEDCLLGKNLKKRLLVEKGYTLDRTIQRIKKGKTDHTKYRAKFEDGIRVSKELCDNKLHHVFYDEKGFEYKIMVSRLNLDRPNANGKSMMEKYTIFLFESHARPHTYMCGAQFSRSFRTTSHYRDQCHPKDFQSAFKDFKYLFKKKTGIDWEMRLEKHPKDENFFVYTPPILGRPVGALPDGYIRPEEREPEPESQDETHASTEEEEDVVYDTDSEVDDSDNENESSGTQQHASSNTPFSSSSSASEQNASARKRPACRSNSTSSATSSDDSPRRSAPFRAISISSDEDDESQ